MSKEKSKDKSKEEEKTMTIEETFTSLDEIIAKLESDDISLEESFKLYTEGMELSRKCQSQIDEVEKKVMIIQDSFADNTDGDIR